MGWEEDRKGAWGGGDKSKVMDRGRAQGAQQRRRDGG